MAAQPAQDRRGEGLYFVLLGLIALCYTALRYTFNPEFDDTFYQKIYDFIAPAPFGKRILIALLAHPLVNCGFSVARAFQFWEVVSAFCLFAGLYRVFSLQVEKSWAKVMGAGFALILPPVFLLRNTFPYRFPWDTPAMAVLAWGAFFLLRGQWGRACVLMIFATLNRESAILIPLLFGVMYFDRLPLRKLLLVGTALVAIYAAVSWAVSLTLGDNLSYYGPNSLASLHKYGKWRLFINLAWLNYSIRNYLVLLATLGGLPLVFLAFLRWIPAHLRGFGLVALFYFELLACVGNLYESRIFGEIATLLYIPAALGGGRYLRAGMPWPDFQLPGQANRLNPCRPRLEIAAAVILVGLLIALGIVLKAIPAPYIQPLPF